MAEVRRARWEDRRKALLEGIKALAKVLGREAREKGEEGKG